MKSIIINLAMIILMFLFPADAVNQVMPGEVQEDKLVLYPNPTDGPLHIDFLTDMRINPVAVILDMTGKKVKQIANDLTYTDDRFSGEMDVSDLKPGIYFVKINQLNKASIKKFIIR